MADATAPSRVEQVAARVIDWLLAEEVGFRDMLNGTWYHRWADETTRVPLTTAERRVIRDLIACGQARHEHRHGAHGRGAVFIIGSASYLGGTRKRENVLAALLRFRFEAT